MSDIINEILEPTFGVMVLAAIGAWHLGYRAGKRDTENKWSMERVADGKKPYSWRMN